MRSDDTCCEEIQESSRRSEEWEQSERSSARTETEEGIGCCGLHQEAAQDPSIPHSRTSEELKPQQPKELSP